MLQDTVEYCRIENGKIVEYPVLEIHIRNRGHAMEMYTKVVHMPKPFVHEFAYLTRKIELADGVPVVVYSVEHKSIDAVLSDLYYKLQGDSPLDTTREYQLKVQDIPKETMDFVLRMGEDLVDKHLNSWCAQKGYTSIVTMATYATSTNPERAKEGAMAVQARDDAWDAFYAYFEAVKSGAQPFPMRSSDITAQLPVLTWDSPAPESVD